MSPDSAPLERQRMSVTSVAACVTGVVTPSATSLSNNRKRAAAAWSDTAWELRRAKSRDSYRRIASESYRCDSNH